MIKNKPFLFVSLFVILLSTNILACDPNDPLPSALPPAPSGGIIAEAKKLINEDSSQNVSEIKEDSKIYWEGTYDRIDKVISLQLLNIVPPKIAVFSPVLLNEQINDIQIKIERPREGRTESVQSKFENNKLIIDYDSVNSSRFIIHISANFLDKKNYSKNTNRGGLK